MSVSSQPLFDFGRGLCNTLPISSTHEWLVTNGIGGYAAGTISGILTRRYHGLLIAALQPPLGRTLLLTKLDDAADYSGSKFPLTTNQWGNRSVEPGGYLQIERFHLEGTTPVWTFACADALLEKRVWMQPGANTTYIRYTLKRATAPLSLTAKAIVNYRDHHANTRAGWQMDIQNIANGLKVIASDSATPFYLLSDKAQASPKHDWYLGYFLSVEDYRGLDSHDDNLCGGIFQATLNPGDSVTIVASTRQDANLDGMSAYTERAEYERGLIQQSGLDDAPPPIRHLALAADQFIVRRTVGGDAEGRSVLAGYPWFGDWGRDTMISLSGLTLSTRRYDVARRILSTFAHFVDRGMLPNRFPDDSSIVAVAEMPEYNTVDATLWYFEAIRAYHAATRDDGLLRELFPALKDIVDWHIRGTRYSIHLDLEDGLLYSGEAGVQLTWMDVKIGDWVVTPRTGKAVEINALWHNALKAMAEFAGRLGEPAGDYEKMAQRMRFSRFWNPALGCCFDVLDTPTGDDAALRPNQLFAVSLPHSALTPEQQRGVVDVCTRTLLTSHGLRSLSATHPDYKGHYGGDTATRDAAYHQGAVWGWLIGPFVLAHFRVYGDRALAQSYLRPLLAHLHNEQVGSISEIFDGNAPFTPRGCFAQAWSVAELLRAWLATAQK